MPGKTLSLLAMQNRWSQIGLQEVLDQWSSQYGDDYATRLYSAQLIGSDPDLVLHGGGNVSLKGQIRDIHGEDVEVVFVKASGGDMGRLEPRHLPALRLEPLRKLRTHRHLDDDLMINQVRLALLRCDAPTPSIETLLHAFLPQKFVDHSHADVILALTNQAGGDTLIREALGDQVAYLPYIRPGFELAKAVADCVDARPDLAGVVLLFHGLLTFADQAKVAYDNHIKLCTACEEFLARKTSGRSLTVSLSFGIEPSTMAARVAPVLRGILAEPRTDDDQRFNTVILEYRNSEVVRNYAASREAAALSAMGSLTGDHVMHTRPRALHLSNPNWDQEENWRQQLCQAVRDFRADYGRYLNAHGKATTEVDLCPRVVWLPGVGLITAGHTKARAIVAADLAEHTARVKTLAQFAGEYQSLSEDHLFDMEFRTIQRAKLNTPPEGVLTGQVVVVSGAAGAIGAAIAEACAQAGAHVVLTDKDESRLRRVEEYLNDLFGVGRTAAVPIDVTDEASVRYGFARIALLYGGLDVLVPNAGIAHVAPIDSLELTDLRRVMDVNAMGTFLFMREGIRLMKQQATGGSIIIISSKNVFAPGRDFAAYSASKAAAHQLGRVAALELAPFSIRVNMINPDAVFGDETISSGLWDTIAANRAASRNIAVEDLPEFYRQRNLLKTRVHARHVANAVVFFASRSTPTTGATLPVDGGILEAFPR